MSYFSRKAVRESLSEDLVPDSVNLEAPSENLDAALAELPSLEVEMDEMDAASDVLESDIEKVEGHIETADEAIEEGEELDEGTVAQIEVGQESIRRRYRINTARVARESFRNGARGVTVVARESWQDTLKDLWARFLDLLKAARRKIIETKLKYFNAGKSAQSRSKKYTKAMEKLGSEKSKEDIQGAFIGYLSIDRKFDLDGSIQTARNLGGAMKTAIGQFTNSLNNVTHQIEVGEDGKLSQEGKEVDLGGVSSKLQTLPGLETAGSSYKVTAFPGDNYVQYGEVKSGDNTYTVLHVVNGGDKPDDNTIPTPSHGDIRKAISGLNAVGASFEKLLKDFDAYDRNVEKLEKAVEKLVDKFHKATEDTDRATLDVQRAAAKAEVDKYKACNRLAKTVNTTVIKGLDGFIKAGMGSYKKAKS